MFTSKVAKELLKQIADEEPRTEVLRSKIYKAFLVRFENDDDHTTIESKKYFVDGRYIRLYDFSSLGWCWSQYTPEQYEEFKSTDEYPKTEIIRM